MVRSFRLSDHTTSVALSLPAHIFLRLSDHTKDEVCRSVASLSFLSGSTLRGLCFGSWALTGSMFSFPSVPGLWSSLLFSAYRFLSHVFSLRLARSSHPARSHGTFLP
ncbi:unnamed protein product [Ectocarpus sp. 12 AP-2014]